MQYFGKRNSPYPPQARQAMQPNIYPSKSQNDETQNSNGNRSTNYCIKASADPVTDVSVILENVRTTFEGETGIGGGEAVSMNTSSDASFTESIFDK